MIPDHSAHSASFGAMPFHSVRSDACPFGSLRCLSVRFPFVRFPMPVHSILCSVTHACPFGSPSILLATMPVHSILRFFLTTQGSSGQIAVRQDCSACFPGPACHLGSVLYRISARCDRVKDTTADAKAPRDITPNSGRVTFVLAHPALLKNVTSLPIAPNHRRRSTTYPGSSAAKSNPLHRRPGIPE